MSDDSAPRPPVGPSGDSSGDRLGGPSSGRRAIEPDRVAVPSGWRLEVVAESASTNAEVADRARVGEAPGLVLVTEHQTAGRGRLDRAWETPARSSLTFSVLLRPDVGPQRWSWLPLLTGYAVQAAVADRVPDVGLKWPNDVLVEGRKLAGILVERVEGPDGPVAVVGVGINVDQVLDELPVAQATSLTLETGEPVDRTDLLGQVLGSLHGLQGLLEDGPGLRAAYADTCVTLGQTVDVHLPGGAVRRGEALDVDDSGALVVATEEGTTTVAAGDVVHVRPAG